MLKDMQPRQVVVPAADIRGGREAERLRQLLFGETVTPVEERGELVKVKARRDGYCGYMRRSDLGPVMAPTHRVTAPATILYSAPDIRAPERLVLSFGSLVTVIGQEGRFAKTHQGLYVPSAHLNRVGAKFSDPVDVAELFLGTPYLWGGNSRQGIDCSGLVQAACLACGIACPGDSGEQAQSLGEALDPEAPLQRGDLMFWKGHVAWVAKPDLILHANAAYMAVVYEGMEDAVERIRSQGDGDVTICRRIPGLNLRQV